MLFQVHSLQLNHRHFAIVLQDPLAGEFCISDLADELLIPFFQSFVEEGFLERTFRRYMLIFNIFHDVGFEYVSHIIFIPFIYMHMVR